MPSLTILLVSLIFDDSSKSVAVSGTDTKKSATFNGIVNLFLNGEIVAYRVKTVCGDTMPPSLLSSVVVRYHQEKPDSTIFPRLMIAKILIITVLPINVSCVLTKEEIASVCRPMTFPR